MKLWILLGTGLDFYAQPEVLAACTSEEKATELLESLRPSSLQDTHASFYGWELEIKELESDSLAL